MKRQAGRRIAIIASSSLCAVLAFVFLLRFVLEGTGLASEGPGEIPLAHVVLALSPMSSPSTHPPQILTPVPVVARPDWLSGRPEMMIPVIAILVDDCGVDETHTRAAIALPKAISLSFLPYPQASLLLSRAAHAAGHEVLVHLQMQPEGQANPGPMALRVDQDSPELTRRVEWALSRVSDYDGVNNHMGSRFTLSREALLPVLQTLARHRLFFLDSRTVPASQAADLARSLGMLSGARDIFLDDDERAPEVARQLAAAEAHARAYSSVIAIGHPHAETLAALKVWVARVAARGFRLVPVIDVLRLRATFAARSPVAARD